LSIFREKTKVKALKSWTKLPLTPPSTHLLLLLVQTFPQNFSIILQHDEKKSGKISSNILEFACKHTHVCASREALAFTRL
jgi:hypothetical protein